MIRNETDNTKQNRKIFLSTQRFPLPAKFLTTANELGERNTQLRCYKHSAHWELLQNLLIQEYTNADLKFCQYLRLYMKLICLRFHIKTYFTFFVLTKTSIELKPTKTTQKLSETN